MTAAFFADWASCASMPFYGPRAHHAARRPRRDRLRQPVAGAGGRRASARSPRTSRPGRADAGLEVDVLEATPGRPERARPRARDRRRAHAAAVRPPRHRERRGHGRPARAAGRGRPPLRARRLRHEGRASRRRWSRAARPRRSAWRATSSSPRSPTRSTPASACRRCSRAVTADAAIVTEPTELEVVVAHKGFVWSEVEVTGRAAHGSRPHLGVDAIVKAGPVLTAIGALDDALAARTHPLLGRGSVHASLIEGGDELSSYPARCVVGLERRTLPGETAAGVEAELAALLDVCRGGRPGARGRAAHAAGPRAVRGRPGRGARGGRARRRRRGPRHRAGGRRRELLGRRRVHRRRRHPDRDVRARRRGRARGRGVGEPRPTPRRWRGRWSRRPRACAREGARQPRRAARRPCPRRRPRRARSTPALAGYRPTPLRDLDAVAAELGVARRRRSRTSPTGSACRRSRSSARRGRSSARCASTPDVHTLVAASAGNHGRAVAHVAAAARPARPDLPPGPLGGRAARGHRRRGRRGRRRRRRLRGRGGAARREAGARDGALEIADVGETGPARWVIDGYATLFAEAAEQGEHDLIVVPVGVGSLAAAAARFGAHDRRARRRRRARHRRVPDRVARRRAAGDGADAGHDDGGPRLRRGLGRGVAGPARRHPRHGHRGRRRGRAAPCASSPPPGWRSASRAPPRSPRCARWRPTRRARRCATRSGWAAQPRAARRDRGPDRPRELRGGALVERSRRERAVEHVAPAGVGLRQRGVRAAPRPRPARRRRAGRPRRRTARRAACTRRRTPRGAARGGRAPSTSGTASPSRGSAPPRPGAPRAPRAARPSRRAGGCPGRRAPAPTARRPGRSPGCRAR